jgi:uncharacterized damage-inducible protein DinB
VTTGSDELPTADQVRRRNRELDRRLLELFDLVPAERLADDPGGGEWSLAQNLAHIAEFPGYFPRQLRLWLDGERTVVGRVAEHSADRNDAVPRACGRGLDDLRQQAEATFSALAAVPEDLTDEHLEQPMRNVKCGQESLTAFLDRYVIGHKAAHVEQPRSTIAAVTG